MIYEKHIFICTNQRKEGARKCCGEVHGMALVDAFKKKIKEHGLQNTIRAQKTGCFDICEYDLTLLYILKVFFMAMFNRKMWKKFSTNIY